MTAPKPASALEQSFRDIARKHGLTAFNVGLNGDADSCFVAWAHRGNDCANGYGGTISEAIGKALARITRFTPLADESLPELVA